MLFLRSDLFKSSPEQTQKKLPGVDVGQVNPRQLQACPYGGGKKCVERGGDGAEKHYAGYVHPRDLKEHRGQKEEDKDDLADDLEPEEEGQEPEQSLFASEAKKKGVHVESYLNSWDLADNSFDDVVSELFGSDSVDNLLETYQAEQGNIEASLEQIEVHAGLGKVMGAFYDKGQGKRVGLYERQFSYDHNDEMIVVDHSYLRLDEDVKGTGIGKKFLKNSIEKYLSMGVGKITTHPAWDGRYVWAKFGFSWGEGGEEYVRATLPDFLHEEFGVDPDSAEEIADNVADKPWILAATNVNGITIPIRNKETGEDEQCKAGEAYLKSHHGDEVWQQEWGDDDDSGGVMYLNTGDDGFMHLMDYLGIGTKKKRKKRKAS